jgi:hypothetical protein
VHLFLAGGFTHGRANTFKFSNGRAEIRLKYLVAWGLGVPGTLIDETKRRKNMSDVKDKAKQKIDDAADAAKRAASHVVDKSKDVAHSVGKKMEKGGKRLQDA